MTDRKQFIRFLIFEMLFWFGITVLFNAQQYAAGWVICLLFGVWFISMRDQESRFLVLLSGLPFQAITKISDGLPSVAVVLYLLFVVIYLIKSNYHFSWKVVLPILLLVLLSLIACWRFDAQVTSIISGLLMIVFATFAIDMLQNTKDRIGTFVKCAWVFTLAMVVDTYSALIFPDMPYYISYEKQVLLDRAGRFCALNADPNYFGQLVTIAVGFMIAMTILYLRTKKYWFAGLSAAVALSLAVMGLTSLSKGYAVGLGVVLLLTLWFIIMEGRRSKWKILRFVLYLAVAAVAIYLIYTYIFIPIVSSRSNVDLFTGRLDVWGNYLRMFSEQPNVVLLGMGFNNSWLNIVRYAGQLEAAHNLYIEVIGDIGVIGFALVVALWLKAFRKVRALAEDVTSLFMWGFLVTSFSLSASANDIMYFVVPIFTIAFSSSEYLRRPVETTVPVFIIKEKRT
ncbi:MAG: O-antigen ligase family protein [Clostridia bacterium]|nr:O-antigen ligase family protein [Clostridia bacterium]